MRGNVVAQPRVPIVYEPRGDLSFVENDRRIPCHIVSDIETTSSAARRPLADCREALDHQGHGVGAAGNAGPDRDNQLVYPGSNEYYHSRADPHLLCAPLTRRLTNARAGFHNPSNA